jgi:PAS domain S-box-containing protein
MKFERRLRELLEAAPDAILEVDRDGRIVLLNAVAEKMFGYSREELLGQPVELLIPFDLRGRHEQHRSAYKSHPTTRPMGSGLDLYAQRKDGTRFPVEISLSPVKSDEGLRVSAIVRDVTEREQAEQKIRAMHELFTRELSETNRQIELRNREVEREPPEERIPGQHESRAAYTAPYHHRVLRVDVGRAGRTSQREAKALHEPHSSGLASPSGSHQ